MLHWRHSRIRHGGQSRKSTKLNSTLSTLTLSTLTLSTLTLSTFDFVDFRLCRACRSFVESWPSPARATLLSNNEPHIMIFSVVTSEIVSTLLPVHTTKSNLTARRGRQCRQTWTCSTWSTLSKAGEYCCKNVAQMSNVFSTVGRLCRIRQNRPWRIRLCRQCVPGLRPIQCVSKIWTATIIMT